MSDDLPPEFDVLDDRRSWRLDRREFLAFVGASLASACSPEPETTIARRDTSGRIRKRDTFSRGDTSGRDATDAGPDGDTSDADAPDGDTTDAHRDTRDSSVFGKIPSAPFELGVASGDPMPERVVLWTRLIPEPMGSTQMPSRKIPVIWEVAESEPPRDVVTQSFDDTRIVRSGTVMAKPEWAHSVHVDVSGLEPDSWYTYRFRIGNRWTSRTGQTRTLPRPKSRPDSFRVVTACCQSYPEGYFNAHRHIARESGLDALFFLGDYVYEKTAGEIIRPHPDGVPANLDAFRRRYALYKAQTPLQEAHAHCPWIVTWDDHEVRNNYAGDETVQNLATREFKKLRAAAYKAYYEHLPLRVPERPDGGELEIYRKFQVGDLVEFDVLDGRQYRSDVICGGDAGTRCDAATDPSESMLGDEQRRWLLDAFRSSSTIWHAMVQQTIFTPINFNNTLINPDMWDGYQSERQQIIDTLAGPGVDNPMVLTGDIHMGMLLDVPRDDDDPGDDPVAPEIVTTSITSEETTNGWASRLSSLVPFLGQVRHFNPSDRGYTLLEYGRDVVTVHFRTVSTVDHKRASLETDASYQIERGSGDVTEL